MLEVVLFVLGALLGLYYFGVTALPMFYGLPKGVLCAVRGKCGWRVPLKYLLVAVFWIAIFFVAFVALAVFWSEGFYRLLASDGFATGSAIGFWGAALLAIFSRSAREDLRQDFEAFVKSRPPVHGK
jgi:hypothetical protein